MWPVTSNLAIRSCPERAVREDVLAEHLPAVGARCALQVRVGGEPGRGRTGRERG